MKPLKIRAHHLQCIPRFYHGGYNKRFAENMKKICQYIRKNPDTKIKVLSGKFDDICKECPYKQKNKCVQSKEIAKWVVFQDKKIIKFLGLKPNKTYAAKDVFNSSMEKINPRTISKACRDCILLQNCMKIGINNSFRNDLNQN